MSEEGIEAQPLKKFWNLDDFFCWQAPESIIQSVPLWEWIKCIRRLRHFMRWGQLWRGGPEFL